MKLRKIEQHINTPDRCLHLHKIMDATPGTSWELRVANFIFARAQADDKGEVRFTREPLPLYGYMEIEVFSPDEEQKTFGAGTTIGEIPPAWFPCHIFNQPTYETFKRYETTATPSIQGLGYNNIIYYDSGSMGLKFIF